MGKSLGNRFFNFQGLHFLPTLSGRPTCLAGNPGRKARVPVIKTMIYKVKARYKEDKLDEFYQKLTDGTIRSQQPDGEEIVASMKRAKITAPGVIEWYEKCFCPTPLQHERATVYDQYLTDIETEEAGAYGEVEGASFWERMEKEGNR